MNVFVDTSALYAVLCDDDPNHQKAKNTWNDILEKGESLVCTNYIFVECSAILQNRVGMNAVRGLYEDGLPVLHMEWIDHETHQKALNYHLYTNRRQLSLVDCTSFEAMRKLGIRVAFAFDPHFSEQGFDVIP